jgi:hypothetical protein
LDYCKFGGFSVEEKAHNFYLFAKSKPQDEIEDLIIGFVIFQKERIDRTEITSGRIVDMMIQKSSPKIQIFDNTEDEETPETRQYYCAICKGKLTYMKYTDTIWKCDNCQEIYDTKIQDRPIKNEGFKVTPHHDINRYPKLEDDSDIPFVNGINLDEREDPSIELVKSSQDPRTKHYRIRDNVTVEETFRRTRNL